MCLSVMMRKMKTKKNCDMLSDVIKLLLAIYIYTYIYIYIHIYTYIYAHL